MTIKLYRLVILTAVFLTVAPLSAPAEPPASREYQIKAAFLYNFIRFVEWPKDVLESPQEQPIVIGILGKDPFAGSFDPLKDKLVEGKKVVIKRFKGPSQLKEPDAIEAMAEHPQLNEIVKCRIVFICRSENKHVKDITGCLRRHPVLTVGDTKGFLDGGGVINFVLEDKKVRFEICLACAKDSQLGIRSQLLRLARRIIKSRNEHADKQ